MFYSILFPTREQHDKPRHYKEPSYFKDLNLDTVFAPILMDEEGFGQKVKKDLGLESFYYTPLRDREIVEYRQDIMRELESDELCSLIVGFVNTINDIQGVVKAVHNSIESTIKWQDNYLVRGQLLESTERYSKAVSSLLSTLSEMNLRSEGLRNFAEYLKEYLESKKFTEMCRRAKKLREELSSVEYCMHIKIPTIRVRKYEGQIDQAKDLLAVFSKFKQEDVHEFRRGNPDESQDLRMEATVLNMVAVLYKEIFAELDDFSDEYYSFADETILRFIKEIQFYILWLELIEPLRQAGLSFCYPIMKKDSEHIYSRECFDIALAFMNKNGDAVVTNSFELRSPEKIIVITGPNQGGKTTFARAFGQINHLASLGLCVPGCEAELYLFENILTHFEREEDLSTLSGMLQDDLVRLRDLLDSATSESIIIINEIFGSTTFMDALSLGKRMMTALDRLGAFALVVTFLDELATHSSKTVSMMSTVDEDDPGKRTFKIVRKPPDGLAYAIHLAKKHAVTYDQIIGRLTQ